MERRSIPASFLSDSFAANCGPQIEQMLNTGSKGHLEAITDVLASAEPSSDLFAECYSHLLKYLEDVDTKIKQKAFDALLILTRKSLLPPYKILNETITVILKSCREFEVKDKALDTLYVLAKSKSTCETVSQVLRALLSSHADPAMLIAALDISTKLISKFGNNFFPIEDIGGVMVALSGSASRQVREGALRYWREAYRCDKAAAMKFIDTAGAEDSISLRELVEAKQLPKSADGEADFCVEEVSISKRFGDQWCYQLISTKKWNEKRDKLEELLKAISAKRIKKESCAELVKTLKELLKDSNSVITNLALKIIGQLSKGLKGHFATHAKHCFELIIQKYKDKKAVVEVQKCVESLACSLRFEEMVEPIREALIDKSPIIKASVCTWLESVVFPKLSPALAKSMAGAVGPILIKMTDDASAKVREAALMCIGGIRAVVGNDSGLEKLINDLSEHKRERLDMDLSKDRVGSETKETLGHKIEATPDSSCNRVDSSSKSLSSAKPKKTNPRAKPASNSEAPPEEDLPPAISSANATKAIYENIPPVILAQFDMTDNKEKKEGLKELKTWIEGNREKAQEMAEAIVMWVKRKVNNFSEESGEIMAESFALLRAFCEVCVVNKRFAYEVVPPLTERMGDAKFAEDCMAVILSVADSVNPSYVATLTIKACYLSKSGSVMKGGLTLLNKLIEEFGTTFIPLKYSVDYAKHCLDSKHASVHTAAVQYLATAYGEMGKSVKPWLASLKSSTVKMLEAEFSKSGRRVFSKITRNLKGETAALADRNTHLTGYSIPRADISPHVTPDLLSKLTSSSINVRQEAKATLEKVLESCNSHILPTGLSALMSTLRKQIMAESETTLLIELIGNLAVAMRAGFEEYYPEVFECLLHRLASDQNEAEILKTMEKVVAAIGPEAVLKSICKRLENCLEVKKELLQWVIDKKELLGNEKMLLKTLVLMLNGTEEIKIQAEQLIKEMLKDVDYREFVNVLKDLKSVENVDEILDKFNPDKENRQSIILEAVALQPTYKRNAILPAKSKLKHFEALTTRMARANSRVKLNLSLADRNGLKDHTLGEMSMSRSTKNLSQHFDVRSKSKIPEFKKAARRLSNPTNGIFSQSMEKNPFASSQLGDSVVLSPAGGKEKRGEQRLKHPLAEFAKERLESLRKSLQSRLSPELLANMFSQHAGKNLNAVSVLAESLENEFAGLLELFDLLVKWMGAKVTGQTSTTVVRELMKFLGKFLRKMKEEKYRMYEFEVGLVVAMLCEKLGSDVREQAKELLGMLMDLCEPAEVCNHLMATLEMTKNKKTKLEALMLIKEFTRKYSLSKSYTSRDIKFFTKLVVSSDNILKSESLDILHEVYKTKGELLWKLVGDIPESAKIAMARKFNALGAVGQNTRRSRRANNPSVDLGRSSEGSQILGRRMRNVLTKTLNRSKPRIASPTNCTVSHDSSMKSGSTLKFGKETTDTTQQNGKEIDTLEEALELLKAGEIAKRVEALMYLNEKTSSSFEEEERELVRSGDKLLATFAEVLDEIFESPPKDVPIRFAKYFMTVVSKVCTNKVLISKVKKQSFLAFTEQLLTKLLYEGLEKLGDSGEGEYLVKVFNSTMLRVLEYYDPTKSFLTLLDLFKKFKAAPPLQNGIRTSKLPGLIVKCILKMTNAIYTFIQILDASKILLSLHDYLLASGAKTGSDDIGIRMAKTVIYELVSAKGEAIWDDYKPIELSSRQDTQIKLWINLILKSTHPISASPPKYTKQSVRSKDPLQKTFERLQSRSTYQDAVKELYQHLLEHPDTDLAGYFAGCRTSLRTQVMASLEECREAAGEDELLAKDKEYSPHTEEEIAVSTSNAESSLSEYESRMAYLQQKFFDRKESGQKKADNLE